MTRERRKSVVRFAAATVAIALVPFGLAGLALVASSMTWEGRALGVAAAMLAASAWVALREWRRGLLVLALGLAIVVGVATEENAFRTNAPRGPLSLVGPAPFPLAPTQLVPEADQLLLGSHLVEALGGLDARRGDELRALLRERYARVLADPDTAALPSLLGDAIADDLSGRAFLYRPPLRADEKATALLFVHGYGGSWQGYVSVLLETARRRRAFLLEPSCGLGVYASEAELDCVDRAARSLASERGVDPSRLDVVALSNGGRAITRLLARGAVPYRSITFLSGVIEPAVIATLEDPEPRRGDAEPSDPSDLATAPPILVLHGLEDDRIPYAAALEGADALRRKGFEVEVVGLEGADHFLVFSREREARQALERFLRARDSLAPTSR